jgi:biotin carboxyl carrier protein
MSDIKFDMVKTESGIYPTQLNRSFCARKPWTPIDPKIVTSFMPGTVIEYCVKAGDNVKKGDRLLLFRAMKMNNIILSPVDGKVTRLGADVGVNIPKNSLLVRLE